MIKKELDYLVYIATLELTTYDYKILLLLLEKPCNQAILAETLRTKRQNIYKRIKILEQKKLIEIDRIEGKNKFYKAITDLDKLNLIIPGQTEFDFREV